MSPPPYGDVDYSDWRRCHSTADEISTITIVAHGPVVGKSEHDADPEKDIL